MESFSTEYGTKQTPMIDTLHQLLTPACFDVRKLTLRNDKPAEAGLCVGRAEII
jgi:hypothetical protein